MPAPANSLSEPVTRIDPDRDLNWSRLPAGLLELKEVMGPMEALALCNAFGGGSLYVPMKPRPDHPIVLAVGRAAGERLCRVYGGDRLNIPKKDAVLRQLREKEIRVRRHHGATIARLASEYNLSRRRVLQILAAGRS